MMRFTARHWFLALAAAALVHGGIAVALLPQMPATGAGAPAAGTMVLYLGSAGGAPRAAATNNAETVTSIEAPAVPEAVPATVETALAKPTAVPAAVSAVVPPTSSEPRAGERLARPVPTPLDTPDRPEPVVRVRGAREIVRTASIDTNPTNPRNHARARPRSARPHSGPASFRLKAPSSRRATAPPSSLTSLPESGTTLLRHSRQTGCVDTLHGYGPRRGYGHGTAARHRHSGESRNPGACGARELLVVCSSAAPGFRLSPE